MNKQQFAEKMDKIIEVLERAHATNEGRWATSLPRQEIIRGEYKSYLFKQNAILDALRDARAIRNLIQTETTNDRP